jgi:class 3 adenylate cyclase
VQIGAVDIGRAVLEPGWRWSNDIKPAVGTEWCEAHHLHIIFSGRFAVETAAGERGEYGPGDVVDVPPQHDAWVVGDEAVSLLDIAGNSAGFGLPVPASRRVRTMLMSDIVASTDAAARLGDAEWRSVLGAHDRAVRRQLDRFRGHEIKTTGDGFLATFDSAGAAVRCALAMLDEARQIGIELRIGVHTGEVEEVAGDIHGIAVHATARIMAAAGASEVLVSPVTRALADGSGVAFASRGGHELKGIETPMELFAATSPAG